MIYLTYFTMERLYILEAQEFIPMVGYKHIGYVNKIFKTKRKACQYYDNNYRTVDNEPNGLRRLNAHNTYRSDWHPETNLRYVVRRFDCEVLTL